MCRLVETKRGSRKREREGRREGSKEIRKVPLEEAKVKAYHCVKSAQHEYLCHSLQAREEEKVKRKRSKIGWSIHTRMIMMRSMGAQRSLMTYIT